tara:strand:+ start:158 stop:454 length:297 start_codon:yes stop_codon:yes gene_type:complete
MNEGLKSFFKSEIESCEYCNSDDIYIINIRFVEEPRGFIENIGTVFAENHPGVHVKYKCMECKKQFNRKFDPNYILTAAETWVGKERARRLIKAITGL